MTLASRLASARTEDAEGLRSSVIDAVRELKRAEGLPRGILFSPTGYWWEQVKLRLDALDRALADTDAQSK